MDITLKPKQAQQIERYLQSGRYASAEEAIAAALELLSECDRHYQAWLESTRAAVATGMAEAERGETIPSEVVFARLRQKVEAQRAEQA
ncbi:MAG: type II toxin-antitoxin system ParD family antitoxin [Spirulinaceae cyanobacterium RM2_2_10]|nr:type II toxin-antitoxin system ParD family antitoxin [Spirulinaceae cyanobacterium SM2_1_0]NJO21223.1 type II toxin-antitoxin system ParD family antitoxin [Spirulinaceae cyanobacterium RM2_2_10]